MSGGERPSTGIDRAVSMLRLLLASASEDELSRAQALGALVRCPLTMTTRIGGAAPRLTKNDQGELSGALFTGPDALAHAAQRFGWGEVDLEFGVQTLPGADALRRLLEEGAQRVAIDPGAEHEAELLRDEIEVLVSPEADRPSAATAKRAPRRESATQPLEREEKSETSQRESGPLAEIDDPFAGKQAHKPPPRAASRPLGEKVAKKVPRNMASEPFSSVHPPTASARAASSKPPKKVSTKRPPKKDASGALAARRISPVDDTQPFETQGKAAARRKDQPVIVLESADDPPATAQAKKRATIERAQTERAQTEPMTPHAKAAARSTIAERSIEPPLASPEAKSPAVEMAVPVAKLALQPAPQPIPQAPAAVRSADDYDFGVGTSSNRPAVADAPEPVRSSLPASRKRNDEDDDRLTMPETVTRDSLRVALERAEVEVGTRERLLATIVGQAEPAPASAGAAAPAPIAQPEPIAAPPAPPPAVRDAPAREPSAPPAARMPAARAKPEARESTVSVTGELREPEAAIDDKPLRALADALRLYPEVEWACHVSDGEAPALIGVRVEPSFLTRVEEIATALHGAGGEFGIELRVLLLTDAARMREARAKGKVFFPWRTRDAKRETKQ